MKFYFYAAESDLNSVAIKLAEKCFNEKKRCLLLVNSRDEISFFDDKLWSYSKLSFIPHGSRLSLPIEDAAYCSIWIDDSLTMANSPTYLISISRWVYPQDIQSLERASYIFPKEELSVMAGHCRSSCISSFKLWIQSSNSWVESNFP